jgi:hypothetical protein
MRNRAAGGIFAGAAELRVATRLSEHGAVQQFGIMTSDPSCLA